MMYVDDTYVFFDRQEDYQELLDVVHTKYTTTSSTDSAVSFLSINIETLEDGSFGKDFQKKAKDITNNLTSAERNEIDSRLL